MSGPVYLSRADLAAMSAEDVREAPGLPRIPPPIAYVPTIDLTAAEMEGATEIRTAICAAPKQLPWPEPEDTTQC